MDATLAGLADAFGIEARYWDIHGKLHETTSETMQALLPAWGVDISSPDGIRAAWLQQEETAWRNVLPPVVIARDGAPASVPIRLPSDGVGAVRWRLELESGEVREGDVALDTLPVESVGQADGRQVAGRRLAFNNLPLGYHDLTVESDRQDRTRLIVAPARCYLPPKWSSRRSWGLAAQLYALRSADDWGIGDFTGLQQMINRLAPYRADAIGLNPLHALFLDTPQDASPYSPSSRLYRNPLYLDVAAIPDFAECGEARAMAADEGFAIALRAVRAADHVDYPSVARLKFAVLEKLHAHFRRAHQNDERARAFAAYRAEQGENLERFAAFQALSEQFGSHAWTSWPGEFRDGANGGLALFRERCGDRLGFFEYLQWQCEEQLAATAVRARDAGMAIGLYNDLAVSVDAHSADHWSHRDLFAGNARVGAPPDPFNETGQEWGVVPLVPSRLKANAYAYFAALLRANMRHTGALRIDHVMGWQRLFWIPAGAKPSQGAYVRYPIDDFLAIAALESQRHRCLLVGEDLGTVAEGFRERMADASVLSCRVFYFERDYDRFRSPRSYPPLAAVSASTHDLPTLRGFWEACDLDAKAKLGLFASQQEQAEALAARQRDKRAMLQVLADEGLLPPGGSFDDLVHAPWTPDLALAVHRVLARAPSRLLMVQLDDLACEAHQTNLPGSTVEYPNWRRRFRRPVGPLTSDPAVSDQMAALGAERAE